ncbi:hypothetical protein [Chryseobacterium soldanellicola]|nr:hypothetical protein [Chryseobacterium soldanellicola]
MKTENISVALMGKSVYLLLAFLFWKKVYHICDFNPRAFII